MKKKYGELMRERDQKVGVSIYMGMDGVLAVGAFSFPRIWNLDTAACVQPQALVVLLVSLFIFVI